MIWHPFLQESRLTAKEFILAFWLRCVLLPWQRGWLKGRLKKMSFVYLKKKRPVVWFFSSFTHYELT